MSKRKRRTPFHSLADYIARSGDTQERLAGRVGISQAHISRLVKGEAVPRAELAVRIVRHTGIPLESFLLAKIKHDKAVTA
jgi:transcriptional regulator with XRE-family HTH domain